VKSNARDLRNPLERYTDSSRHPRAFLSTISSGHWPYARLHRESYMTDAAVTIRLESTG
jgi:hypothetical protein